MNDAASVLVIILSVVLAVFLILSIILVVLLIRISKQIKNVASNMESATQNIGTVAANIGKYTTPAVLGKAILSQFNKFKR